MKTLDIQRTIDERGFTPLTVRTLILLFLATTFEGYDLGSAAYAAPGIVDSLGLEAKDLAPMFSVGPLGMLIGAPLFGYIGDRIGRKPTIIFCLGLFGLFSLMCAFATSIEMITLLRLGVGIGAGGLLPNNIALMSEFAPVAKRALCTIMVTLGMTVGGISAALVTALGDLSDWQNIFLVGGLGPVVLIPLLYFYLPESLRFLGAHNRNQTLCKQASELLGAEVSSDTQITGINLVRSPAAPVKQLFAGVFLWITPVLWLTYICIMIANSALNSWIPTLLHQQGLEIRETALTAMMYEVGGILGGLTAARLIDRHGVIVISFYFVLTCTVVGFVGMPDLTQFARGAVVFATGFFILGTQQGMNTTAFLYPTTIRGRGYGFANAVGRLGAICGPAIFGFLIALQIPPQQLFFAPAVPLLIGGILCTLLAYLVRKTQGQGHTNESIKLNPR